MKLKIQRVTASTICFTTILKQKFIKITQGEKADLWLSYKELFFHVHDLFYYSLTGQCPHLRRVRYITDSNVKKKEEDILEIKPNL